MLTIGRRRALDFAFRTAEARRHIGLHHAVNFNQRFTRLIMRMVIGFIHIKNRRIANISAQHNGVPFVAGFGLKGISHFLLQIRPGAAIHLRVKGAVIKTGFFAQQGIKLRFDLTNGNEFAVGGFVNIIKMRRPIEHVIAAIGGPNA